LTDERDRFGCDDEVKSMVYLESLIRTLDWKSQQA